MNLGLNDAYRWQFTSFLWFVIVIVVTAFLLGATLLYGLFSTGAAILS